MHRRSLVLALIVGTAFAWPVEHEGSRRVEDKGQLANPPAGDCQVLVRVEGAPPPIQGAMAPPDDPVAHTGASSCAGRTVPESSKWISPGDSNPLEAADNANDAEEDPPSTTASEPYEEVVHRALMRARVTATPGERHPNTDLVEVVLVDGLNRYGGHTGAQVSGLASEGEMLIRVNRRRLDLFSDASLVEDLVYHEFAHLIDGEPGHGSRWMAIYMGLVERWLPEHAEVRWNNVSRKYKAEADAEVARTMLREKSLHQLFMDTATDGSNAEG